MSVIWHGDLLCFSLIITSPWGHSSLDICHKNKMVTSVGICRFVFYFKFFKMQIDAFPGCLQRNSFQPSHRSFWPLFHPAHPTFVYSLQMNSLHSVGVKGPASSSTFTPAYPLVSYDAIGGTFWFCLCVKKRVYTLLFSRFDFFFLEGKIIKQCHFTLLKHWFLVWNELCKHPGQLRLIGSSICCSWLRGLESLSQNYNQASLVKPSLGINKKRDSGSRASDVWFDCNSQSLLLRHEFNMTFHADPHVQVFCIKPFVWISFIFCGISSDHQLWSFQIWNLKNMYLSNLRFLSGSWSRDHYSATDAGAGFKRTDSGQPTEAVPLWFKTK